MPNKKYLLLEICGGLFTAAASVFISVWEACKTLLLPFFIWSLLESLIYRMSICRYTASKTISLYLLGVMYIVFRQTPLDPYLAAAVSLISAISLSIILYISPLPLQKLFAPSVAAFAVFVHLAVFRPYAVRAPF